MKKLFLFLFFALVGCSGPVATAVDCGCHGCKKSCKCVDCKCKECK